MPNQSSLWFELLIIGFGGCLGTLLRYFLSIWVSGMFRMLNFPLGILVCNALGCFLVGVFAGFILFQKAEIHPWLRAFLIIGFCGGFTTFSSFSLDVIRLLKAGNMGVAFVNIGASLGLCLLATYLGMQISRVIK